MWPIRLPKSSCRDDSAPGFAAKVVRYDTARSIQMRCLSPLSIVGPAIALSPSLQVLVEEGDRTLNRALPLALECVALPPVSDECDIFAGRLQRLDRRF